MRVGFGMQGLGFKQIFNHSRFECLRRARSTSARSPRNVYNSESEANSKPSVQRHMTLLLQKNLSPQTLDHPAARNLQELPLNSQRRADSPNPGKTPPRTPTSTHNLEHNSLQLTKPLKGGARPGLSFGGLRVWGGFLVPARHRCQIMFKDGGNVAAAMLIVAFL